MATLNRCEFIGRLGQEPEMNVTPGGKAVTRFSLAVDKGKDEQGNKRPPLWLTIICWEKLAERTNLLLYKGAEVFVAGRFEPRTYIGSKDKKEHIALDIIASDVQLLSKPKNSSAYTGEDEAPGDLELQA